jgi:hypothetical protein
MGYTEQYVEHLREMREKEIETLRDLIFRVAQPKREERSVATEYTCQPFPYENGEVTRLRVTVTHFDNEPDEDLVSVDAYVHPLTKAGKRHSTRSAHWSTMHRDVATTIIAANVGAH